jgi:hypothetical protein
MIEDEKWIGLMRELIELSKQAPAGPELLLQCVEVANLLLKKNIAYGNSALNPIQIFAKIPPGDQIDVRIDDKLNRIKNGSSYAGDNDILDLVGYLVLKLVDSKDTRLRRDNGKTEES